MALGDLFVSLNSGEFGTSHLLGRFCFVHILFGDIVKYKFLDKFPVDYLPAHTCLVSFSFCDSSLHLLIMFNVVWFYGISTLVGHLIPNPFHKYIWYMISKHILKMRFLNKLEFVFLIFCTQLNGLTLFQTIQFSKNTVWFIQS